VVAHPCSSSIRGALWSGRAFDDRSRANTFHAHRSDSSSSRIVVVARRSVVVARLRARRRRRRRGMRSIDRGDAMRSIDRIDGVAATSHERWTPPAGESIDAMRSIDAIDRSMRHDRCDRRDRCDRWSRGDESRTVDTPRQRGIFLDVARVARARALTHANARASRRRVRSHSSTTARKAHANARFFREFRSHRPVVARRQSRVVARALRVMMVTMTMARGAPTRARATRARPSEARARVRRGARSRDARVIYIFLRRSRAR